MVRFPETWTKAQNQYNSGWLKIAVCLCTSHTQCKCWEGFSQWRRASGTRTATKLRKFHSTIKYGRKDMSIRKELGWTSKPKSWLNRFLFYEWEPLWECYFGIKYNIFHNIIIAYKKKITECCDYYYITNNIIPLFSKYPFGSFCTI